MKHLSQYLCGNELFPLQILQENGNSQKKTRSTSANSRRGKATPSILHVSLLYHSTKTSVTTASWNLPFPPQTVQENSTSRQKLGLRRSILGVEIPRRPFNTRLHPTRRHRFQLVSKATKSMPSLIQPDNGRKGGAGQTKILLPTEGRAVHGHNITPHESENLSTLWQTRQRSILQDRE